jgi:hypothetical protein
MKAFEYIRLAEKEVDESLKTDEYYQELKNGPNPNMGHMYSYRSGRIQMILALQIKK